MKTNLLSFIQITIASLCLTVTSTHAQGNLLENTNWTVLEVDDYPDSVGTIISGGGFYAQFHYAGGSISQTISTTPDANYVLTFQAIQLQGIDASSISIDGVLLADFSPDDPFISPISSSIYGGPNGQENTVWYNFDFNFTASSANTTISFTETPQPYYDMPLDEVYTSTGGLDDISVTEAPEPSTVALLGVGLVGLLAFGWRKGIKS